MIFVYLSLLSNRWESSRKRALWYVGSLSSKDSSSLMLVINQLCSWGKKNAVEVCDKLLQRCNLCMGLLPYELLPEFFNLDVALFWTAWFLWHFLDSKRHHLSRRKIHVQILNRIKHSHLYIPIVVLADPSATSGWIWSCITL